MEKDYKKVVVFTPMSVLEEVSMDETVHHEDILETMFEENLWIPYNEESKDFFKYDIYKHLLHTRASFLAYEVDFSVCYETREHVMFYISDFMTEEMVQYIKNNYEGKRKYLSFATFLTQEDTTRVYYELETNENLDYDAVFQELVKVCYVKSALHETKRAR